MSDIFVVVNQSNFKKVEKVLKTSANQMVLEKGTTLVLVVMDEETESASALKLIKRMHIQ